MDRAQPVLREFVRADWAAICAVHESAARMELARSGRYPLSFRPMTDEENLDTFLRLNTAWVASIDNHVVGFVAWRDRGEWTGSGYLSWLYVDPAHHRRGIGERLLGRAMEALGHQTWTLTSQGNKPAIRLYQRYGMRIVTAYQTDSLGYTYTEVRLALPTSRKSNPDLPNFGI